MGRLLSDDDFKAVEPELRLELVQAQQALRDATFPVIIVLEGIEGAGQREVANLLNRWMDPRFIVTRAYTHPTDEERERPELWRYWASLPERGKIGVFQRSWYERPLEEHARSRSDDARFEDALRRIAAFEELLTDDGALILKFWMHLSQAAQQERLERLQADPLEAWRVRPDAWEVWERHPHLVASAERVLTRTHTAAAPWFLIEGADANYRAVAVGTQVRDSIRSHIQRSASRERTSTETGSAPALAHQPTLLTGIDQTPPASKKALKRQLREQQARLALLQRRASAQGISTIVGFQGWDAAGKGGAIKRLAEAYEAHEVRIHPIGAPSDEEKAQHWLWRFWRRLPRAGHAAIFDRTWYGRVLVERVEGFAMPTEWMRAYTEINHFEDVLVEHGIVLVKLWLHITPDEQLRRFEDRRNTPWKAWKLTDDDWRNREKWPLYERAVHDMVERTSTARAPWTLVPANSKHAARVQIVRTVADRLESALCRASAG